MKEGWEVKKLGDVCEITMGQSPCSESYNDIGKGMPFFKDVQTLVNYILVLQHIVICLRNWLILTMY